MVCTLSLPFLPLPNSISTIFYSFPKYPFWIIQPGKQVWCSCACLWRVARNGCCSFQIWLPSAWTSKKGSAHSRVFETMSRVELVIPRQAYPVIYINFVPSIARTDSLSSQQMHRIDHSENGGHPMSDSRSAHSVPLSETESGSRIQRTHWSQSLWPTVLSTPVERKVPLLTSREDQSWHSLESYSQWQDTRNTHVGLCGWCVMVWSLEVCHAWNAEIECAWYFLHVRHGGRLKEPGCLQESRLSSSMTSRKLFRAGPKIDFQQVLHKFWLSKATWNIGVSNWSQNLQTPKLSM